MRAKTRMLWMKLHGYLACFFLPFTLLYIITGTLYFFDIKGDVTSVSEYSVPLSNGWPTNDVLARPLVERFLKQHQDIELPEDYYFEHGNHDWYGHKREVILINPDEHQDHHDESQVISHGDNLDRSSLAKLVVKEHDLLQQLLIIHKGFAGSFFKLLSILFAASLTFSIISGVVITLQLPQLRVPSMLSILAGGVVLLIGFL